MPGGVGKELILRITQSSQAGAGTELGNKMSLICHNPNFKLKQLITFFALYNSIPVNIIKKTSFQLSFNSMLWQSSRQPGHSNCWQINNETEP